MKRTIQELTNSSHVYNPDAGQNLWWPAYDRLTLDPTINEYVYFATQKGANNKKLSDTNWAAGGQMPANTAIGIEYLNFYYTPAAQKTSEEYSELLTALTTASFAFLINGYAIVCSFLFTTANRIAFLHDQFRNGSA